MNRHDSMTEMNHQQQKRIHKRSTALERSVKIIDGLNMFDGANLALISEVDQDN